MKAKQHSSKKHDSCSSSSSSSVAHCAAGELEGCYSTAHSPTRFCAPDTSKETSKNTAPTNRPMRADSTLQTAGQGRAGACRGRYG